MEIVLSWTRTLWYWMVLNGWDAREMACPWRTPNPNRTCVRCMETHHPILVFSPFLQISIWASMFLPAALPWSLYSTCWGATLSCQPASFNHSDTSRTGLWMWNNQWLPKEMLQLLILKGKLSWILSPDTMLFFFFFVSTISIFRSLWPSKHPTVPSFINKHLQWQKWTWNTFQLSKQQIRGVTWNERLEAGGASQTTVSCLTGSLCKKTTITSGWWWTLSFLCTQARGQRTLRNPSCLSDAAHYDVAHGESKAHTSKTVTHKVLI